MNVVNRGGSRKMKESAVLSTARVGGGVCLAEAEKKCV